MIISYSKTSKEIDVCKETEFSKHSILERQHIEKWVESTPEILGEELLIITNEYDRFDKTNERIDLLALDRDGNIVVIELKRDDSGKNVDLQAIKYAAYCSTITLNEAVEIYKHYFEKNGNLISSEEARQKLLDFITNPDFEEINDKPRIILVSKEFRPEVTATVLWLREYGIDVKCVKFSPYIISEEKIVIEINTIIPLPEAGDYTIKVEKKENQAGKISVTRQEYYEFYDEISKGLSKKLSKHLLTPLAQGYYQIPTGTRGIHFEWGFHGRPRSSFGVELHFERNDIAFNKKYLKSLIAKKAIIEQETDANLIVQENWGQRWSRLYFEFPSGVINEELKKWAIEKMEVLIKELQPEIDKLK